MTNTTAEMIDTLCAKAARLIEAGEYFPGRAHFAALLGERLFLAVVGAGRGGERNGRGTALAKAASMYAIAAAASQGDDAVTFAARAEGCRMACAAFMGVGLEGGNYALSAR